MQSCRIQTSTLLNKMRDNLNSRLISTREESFTDFFQLHHSWAILTFPWNFSANGDILICYTTSSERSTVTDWKCQNESLQPPIPDNLWLCWSVGSQIRVPGWKSFEKCSCDLMPRLIIYNYNYTKLVLLWCGGQKQPSDPLEDKTERKSLSWTHLMLGV